MELSQPDCPLTQTTIDHEIEFTTIHWDFSTVRREWELRIRATAGDRGALESGLNALRGYDTMESFELFRKRGREALLRTVFDETEAMKTVTDHGGFVVGPFHNVHGREQWTVGFDGSEDAQAALAEINNHNDLTVQDRDRLDIDSFVAVLDQYRLAADLVDGLSELTDTERRVTTAAFENGYFNTPREATLDSLGDRLNVSDVAISKTLRRAERKLLAPVVASFLSSSDV